MTQISADYFYLFFDLSVQTDNRGFRKKTEQKNIHPQMTQINADYFYLLFDLNVQTDNRAFRKKQNKQYQFICVNLRHLRIKS
ncbi:MAG: hypothetical protein OXE42_14680 [Gammaproteobacteria bacterium]|nr:hypothetical protein [Gammaproteobacteria bacterium]